MKYPGYQKNQSHTQSKTEILVSIDSVTKVFDDTVAVDEVSLAIHKEEVFALLGGCWDPFGRAPHILEREQPYAQTFTFVNSILVFLKFFGRNSAP